jgi:hypothetical protein
VHGSARKTLSTPVSMPLFLSMKKTLLAYLCFVFLCVLIRFTFPWYSDL